jgi:hypothetical protein
MAEVDRVRITRIVRNLVVNAIEHGENNPVDVYVASNAEAVAVSVRDHGVGMNEEQVEHVFDRFWRADPARKRTLGGSGLGLAISLEDAHLHNGWLQVWGKPGEGSCFRLTIPRRPDQEITSSPLPLPPRDAQIRGSALVAGPLSSDGSVRIQTGSIPIVVETEPEMLGDSHETVPPRRPRGRLIVRRATSTTVETRQRRPMSRTPTPPTADIAAVKARARQTRAGTRQGSDPPGATIRTWTDDGDMGAKTTVKEGGHDAHEVQRAQVKTMLISVFTALALVGCSSIPTSSPVGHIEDDSGDPAASNARIPDGPEPGDSVIGHRARLPGGRVPAPATTSPWPDPSSPRPRHRNGARRSPCRCCPTTRISTPSTTRSPPIRRP